MRLLCILLVGFIFQPIVTGMVGEHDPAQAESTATLTCVQNALGGTAAFAAVSSLYMKGERKPAQSTGPAPIAATREISVVFPNQYLRADRGQPLPSGEGGLDAFVGFDKDVVMSSPRRPDARQAEVAAHQDFAREMLMRLPRTLAGVRLRERPISDSGRDSLAIEASGAEGFRATLVVDRDTCVPIALQDTSTSGDRRVELLEYRLFDGIRFPTVLKTSVGGRPWTEERVSSIEVNSDAATIAFTRRH
jgi:hypothetical protein